MNPVLQTHEHVDVMAYFDGELPAESASQAWSHIEQCADCAAMLRGLRQLSRQLGEWRVEECPERVAERVRAEWPQSVVSRPASAERWWRRESERIWRVGALVAVGASIILLLVLPPVLTRRGDEADMPPSPGGPVALEQGEGTVGTLKVEEHSAFRYPVPGGQGQQSQQLGEAKSISSLDAGAGPLVIRTAEMSLVTSEFDKARVGIESIVRSSNGYVDHLAISGESGAGRSLSGRLRFPESRFDASLDELRKLGRLLSELHDSADVAGQYRDLSARLRNSRNTEQRMLALLRERTGDLKDVIEVEREVSRVRQEIEQMESSLRAMDNKIQYATVEVMLSEEYRASINPPAPSRAVRVRNALVAGYTGVVDSVLAVTVFVLANGPVLLLWIGVPASVAYLIYRIRGRKPKV